MRFKLLALLAMLSLGLSAAEVVNPEQVAPTKEAVQAAETAAAGEAAAPEAELTEAQLKAAARLAEIQDHRWDDIYLTMPYAEATNVCASCHRIADPEAPYKSYACVLKANDTFSGSTNRNLLTVRKLYFDKDDKLVGFMHGFTGCTVDQKNYIMNMFSTKYTMTPMQAKDFSWYKVTDGVALVVECIESKTTRNVYGWQTPCEYDVKAIFYLERTFVRFVNRHGLALLPPEITHQ